ncbi:hypothetical protein HPP92_003821 [Vanilla planifolia]|uniref:Uncharacterized protein n=1 Tax=Vanilla planifolia TaxID=51239 RepID=A0A835S1G2_VANPL|nr:hypothetical protein HPP92_004265 [Vanilla planifolia]KAG0503749.1 hypothetical protein HPP92_003821 [Vanilla planifolia]
MDAGVAHEEGASLGLEQAIGPHILDQLGQVEHLIFCRPSDMGSDFLLGMGEERSADPREGEYSSGQEHGPGDYEKEPGIREIDHEIVHGDIRRGGTNVLGPSDRSRRGIHPSDLRAETASVACLGAREKKMQKKPTPDLQAC